MNFTLKGFFKVWLVLFMAAGTLSATCDSGCCTSGCCGSSSCSSCCDSCGCNSCSDCCSACQNCNYCNFGKTWFSQRDQGSNEYWVMSLTADKRHQFGREEFYGDFAVTLGWQQNFSRYKLSSYFLNSNGKLVVGHNSTADEAFTDVNIRADDLGLSSTFSGCAWLCPKYADFIADFDLYMGWDEFVKGLWTELRVPFVHSRWNAGLGTTVTSEGGTTYPNAFYVSKESAEDVVFTGSCALKDALLGNVGFGDAPRLCAGKMQCCTRKENGLGGIRLALGWDFLRRERGSLGLAVDVAFPAWNKPCKNNCCDLYVFDAKVGSQHSWKVGGVLRGQYMLWDKDEHDQRIDFYLDGRVHGGFSGKTTRLLGLNANGNSCFNHYLLLKKFSLNGDTPVYEGLERAANLLKMQVKANSSVEAQITAMLQYKRGGFVGALGYNFFGRNAEKVCPCCCTSSCCSTSCCGSSCGSSCGSCCSDTTYYYVIKGVASVGEGDAADTGHFYSKTDSDVRSTGTALAATKENLETAAFNFCSTGSCGSCCNDVNYCVASHPKYISNTIFGNLGYNWEDVDWKPYLGIIGKVDIGSSNTALRLWGVYVKGGICF